MVGGFCATGGLCATKDDGKRKSSTSIKTMPRTQPRTRFGKADGADERSDNIAQVARRRMDLNKDVIFRTAVDVI